MTMYSMLKIDDKHGFKFNKRIRLNPVYDESVDKWSLEFKELGILVTDESMDNLLPRMVNVLNMLWSDNVDKEPVTVNGQQIARKLKEFVNKEKI